MVVSELVLLVEGCVLGDEELEVSVLLPLILVRRRLLEAITRRPGDEDGVKIRISQGGLTSSPVLCSATLSREVVTIAEGGLA